MTRIDFITFSTLFPNAQQENHGLFVEQRLLNFIRAYPENSVQVVAPVPWFPFRSRRFGKYSTFARVMPMEQRHGIVIHHPKYPVVPKVGMSIAPALLAAWCLPTIRTLKAHGCRVDLIDAHYFYPDGVAAAILGKWLDVPVVITARGSDVNLISRFAIPKSLMKWAAESSSAVITVSDALRKRLIEIGVIADKIRTLRNGVDLDLFSPKEKSASRQKLQLPADAKIVLCVANLVPVKQHGLLIEAARQLSDEAILVLVGDGYLRKTLEAQVQQSKLGKRVLFRGACRQAELPYYYSAADVCAFTSATEGLANVWMEALACGTPIVSTEVGGAREVIVNQVAGCLVGCNEPMEIARAIQRVLNRSRNSSEIRAYAERFTWDIANSGQYEVFRNVVDAWPSADPQKRAGPFDGRG